MDKLTSDMYEMLIIIPYSRLIKHSDQNIGKWRLNRWKYLINDHLAILTVCTEYPVISFMHSRCMHYFKTDRYEFRISSVRLGKDLGQIGWLCDLSPINLDEFYSDLTWLKLTCDYNDRLAFI